jgi:hypothetical protein
VSDLARFEVLTAVLLSGSDVVLLSERFAAFLRILLPSASAVKLHKRNRGDGSTVRINVRNCLLTATASRLNRL